MVTIYQHSTGINTFTCFSGISDCVQGNPVPTTPQRSPSNSRTSRYTWKTNGKLIYTLYCKINANSLIKLYKHVENLPYNYVKINNTLFIIFDLLDLDVHAELFDWTSEWIKSKKHSVAWICLAL